MGVPALMLFVEHSAYGWKVFNHELLSPSLYQYPQLAGGKFLKIYTPLKYYGPSSVMNGEFISESLIVHSNGEKQWG